jgi:hypothetical protein
MPMLRPPPFKCFAKKAKRGFRGYPMGTIAFYGPDNTRASKVAVAMIRGEGESVAEMERWFCDAGDIRKDARIAAEVGSLLDRFGAHSIAMVDGIIGCPHEEGIDYQGPTCPQCPYWAGRDRWTGKLLPSADK